MLERESNPLAKIVDTIYPDLHNKYSDVEYLQERAILAPKNDIVHDINNHVLEQIHAEEYTYYSCDSVCNLTCNMAEQDGLYPIEFLNTLKFSGITDHILRLKVRLPVMLLRNLNQSEGLCNGTRLIVNQLGKWFVQAQIITGANVGHKVFIPRIVMSAIESKWPFTLKRR